MGGGPFGAMIPGAMIAILLCQNLGITARDRALQAKFADLRPAALQHPRPCCLNQGQETGIDAVGRAPVVDEQDVHESMRAASRAAKKTQPPGNGIALSAEFIVAPAR